MAQTNNFFFDPKYQDFIPVTPDVDLRFIKDLTDTYKKNTDALDQEKQNLLNVLNSLNVHQTFNEDISEYINNVNSQIDNIDSKYQGQLLDRNYQNEIRSLTRRIAGDENLRYMIKTSEQLNKYEDARAQSADYLEFNDPNKQAYDELIKREKGNRPMFSYSRIYADAKPETELANVANAINIDENTVIEFELNENKQRTGNVVLVDKKTRKVLEIKNTMNEYMETYKNTAGGTQLQREAASRGMSYEDVYLEKINGISKVLAVDKAKKALQADHSVNFEIQREAAARDLWYKVESLKLQSEERRDRIFLEVLKLAYEDKKNEEHINSVYDRLNLDAEKISRGEFNQLIKGIGTTHNSTGRTGVSGQTGNSSPTSTSSKSKNPYDAPLRLSTDIEGLVLPREKVSTHRGLNEELIRIQETNRQIAASNKASDITLSDSNADLYQLIDSYANAVNEEAKAVIGKQEVTVNVEGGVARIPLSEAITKNAAALEYYNNAIKSKNYNDLIYNIDVAATRKFVATIGGSTSETFRKYVEEGVLTIREGNGTPDHLSLDKSALLNTAEVKQAIDKIHNDMMINIGDYKFVTVSSLRGAIKNNGARVTLTDMYGNSSDMSGNSLGTVEIQPQQAAEYLYNYLKHTNKGNVGRLLSLIDQSIEHGEQEVFYKQGVGGKGLALSPNGNDDAAKLDANYAATLNTNISTIEAFDSRTGRKLLSHNGNLYMRNAAGQREDSAITYVEPAAIVLGPSGDFMVHMNLWNGDPTKVSKNTDASRVGTAYSIQKENIISAYFLPYLTAEYGDAGRFAAHQLTNNAQWVSSNFPAFQKLDKAQVKTTKYSHISVTKNVNGTYEIYNSRTKERRIDGLNTELNLALVLSLIDYAESQNLHLQHSPQMSGDISVVREKASLNIDEVIRNFNNVKQRLGGNRNEYTPPASVEDASKQIQRIREGNFNSYNTQGSSTNAQYNTQTTGYIPTIPTEAVEQVTSNLDSVFYGLLQAESRGNPNAVNLEKQPNGRPTYAAGKWQFVPSQTWDIVQKAAKDLGLSNDFQIWDNTNKKPGKDFDAFLNNPQLQDEAMRVLVHRNSNEYNKLSNEYKEFLSGKFGEQAIQKYLEIAHYQGSEGAKRVFDYWRNVGEWVPGVAQVEDHQRKIFGHENKPQKPMSSGLDYSLRNLPAGKSISLSDGTVYKKEKPAGVADDNSTAIIDKQLRKIINAQLPKELKKAAGDLYDNVINTTVEELIGLSQENLSALTNPNSYQQIVDYVAFNIRQALEDNTTTEESPPVIEQEYKSGFLRQNSKVGESAIDYLRNNDLITLRGLFNAMGLSSNTYSGVMYMGEQDYNSRARNNNLIDDLIKLGDLANKRTQVLLAIYEVNPNIMDYINNRKNKNTK